MLTAWVPAERSTRFWGCVNHDPKDQEQTHQEAKGLRPTPASHQLSPPSSPQSPRRSERPSGHSSLRFLASRLPTKPSDFAGAPSGGSGQPLLCNSAIATIPFRAAFCQFVGTSSASLLPPQAAGIARFAVPPLPSSSQSPLCSVPALRRDLHALPCSSSPQQRLRLCRGPSLPASLGFAGAHFCFTAPLLPK